jgi:hypothetical protein
VADANNVEITRHHVLDDKLSKKNEYIYIYSENGFQRKIGEVLDTSLLSTARDMAVKSLSQQKITKKGRTAVHEPQIHFILSSAP